MTAALASRDAALAAAQAIGSRMQLGHIVPELAVLLGSGLSGIAQLLIERRSIPYSEIKDFAVPSTAGHPGELHVGSLAGRVVMVLAGRLHLYEGHALERVAHVVRTMHALGVRRLLLCNASGGIRPDLSPGSIALVTDHINLMWRNPLTGAVVPGEERFPDMSAPYDEELCNVMRAAALVTGASLSEVVYAGVTGPSYETRAEVRMLATLGADVVGMSTVPEVIAARALGMKCVALSCVTNRAAGISAQPLSHEEVLRVARGANTAMSELIAEFVSSLKQNDSKARAPTPNQARAE